MFNDPKSTTILDVTLIVNISGMNQAIDKQKIALSTTNPQVRQKIW